MGRSTYTIGATVPLLEEYKLQSLSNKAPQGLIMINIHGILIAGRKTFV